MSDVTLAGWLLEQIAADERIAQTIQANGRWEWREFPAGTHSLGDDNVWAPYFSIDLSTGAVFPVASVIAHIARHDPARVLAECEAKRRIVERCTVVLGTEGWEYDDAPELAEATLRLLALPYADRPGYDESWRP